VGLAYSAFMMIHYALILELLLVAAHGACEEAECDVSLLQRGLSLNDDQLESASMPFANELANLERDVASLQQEEEQAVQAKSKESKDGHAKEKLIQAQEHPHAELWIQAQDHYHAELWNALETLEKQRQSREAEEQRQAKQKEQREVQEKEAEEQRQAKEKEQQQVQEKEQTALMEVTEVMEEILRKEQESEEQRQTQQKEIEKLKAEEKLLMEAIPQSEQKPSLAFLEGLAAVLATNSSKQSAGVSMMATTANSTNSTDSTNSESWTESFAQWMSSHMVVVGACLGGVILAAIVGAYILG